jgi:hypothetical protein
MATTTTTTTTTSPTTTILGKQSLISALLIGIGVGILGWLLTFAFRNYIIEPVFCRSADTFAVCNNGSSVAWAAGYIIAAIVSIVALIRANVYRPLLVVLAALISLWGLGAWTDPMLWYWELLWSAVLFALAYALFAWLASLERFALTIALTIILVIAIRLLGAL